MSDRAAETIAIRHRPGRCQEFRASGVKEFSQKYAALLKQHTGEHALLLKQLAIKQSQQARENMLKRWTQHAAYHIKEFTFGELDHCRCYLVFGCIWVVELFRTCFKYDMNQYERYV